MIAAAMSHESADLNTNNGTIGSNQVENNGGGGGELTESDVGGGGRGGGDGVMNWQNARYKSEILAHPLYEQLLSVHVACLRIATPVDQLPRIDAQLAQSQHVVAKKLDQFMRLTALKKAYADIILNKAKLLEAAARIMVSERKALRFEQELNVTKERALQMLLRTKQMMDSKVYEEGAKEIALSVVSGINSSIFAYGQTSSGKTYTIIGITEYTVADIYDYITRHEERAFVLKFSAMEIYNEAVRDLLSTDSTPVRLLDDPDKGTIVEKLTEETLRDWSHLEELLSICEAQRKVGETSLNETSSRSHQILRLTIESSAHEFLGKDNSTTLAASVEVSVHLRHYQLGQD